MLKKYLNIILGLRWWIRLRLEYNLRSKPATGIKTIYLIISNG
jgi:hypothetical protein